MAARFNAGTSMATTRRTTQVGKKAEPRTSSHYLKSGSTMPGMPGPIRTSATSSASGLKGGKAMGQKPMRQIGHKGQAHNANKLQGKHSGTMGGRSGWMTRGSSGKMEKLAGQAKSFGERKGKSNMY